jgi:cystathionine beta-lyase
MNFDFDTFPDRRASESAKWREYSSDVLPMWVADMDFRSPEPVIQALQERVSHGIFGYAHLPDGIEEAVVAWLSKRHGWQVTPEDLVFVPGVVAGFNLAAHAVTRPGDGIVLQTPTYGPFFRVAGNFNLIQQEMGLTQESDGQYKVDYDAFEACMTGRSRIFMLCNPQNPTGRVFQQNELEAMAEICLRHDVIICSDEIHSDLVFSGAKHIPIAAISPEIAAQTITLIAPSKTFNIAGLDASVAIITNKKLRNQFTHAKNGLLGSVNLLGTYAARAAYQDGEPWLVALLQYLESNRDLLYDYIYQEMPGVSMVKPEGTYLAWLDCREARIEGKPCDFFVDKARVVMNDGEWFGKGGEGFVRLNFGCPRAMLESALTKMKEALISK